MRPNGVARVEAEFGFGWRDVPPSETLWDKMECAALVDAILPCMEIVETRLTGAAAQDPLWKRADPRHLAQRYQRLSLSS